MDIHLITIKIGIVGCADTFVESEGVPGLNFDFMGHHGHSVEGRLSIEDHHIFVLDVTEDGVSDLEIIS